METTCLLVINFLILVNSAFTQVVPSIGPIVSTDVGIIRGVTSEDGDYNMYMGIPYGQVDETNPFTISTPYPKFDGIFEADDDSSICPQEEEFNNTIVGDIDCLRLNVYTPINANATSRLPVLVWIYGGGFNIGFYGKFMYGPKFLVRHDIILVTINYRVNVFGFMCLDIPEVPGNQGLRDQLLALKWVQSHISAFGGDPNQVTVAGNSAGSMSIDFHLRANKSEGLFHRAILQSGTALTFGSFEPERDAPITLARHFGFETEDIYEAIHFLAGKDPKEVVALQLRHEITTSVCIENEFDGVESYLTGHNFNMTVPAVKNIPMIVGVNDDESGMMRSINFGRDVLIPAMLASVFDTEDKDFDGVTDLVAQFYLGDEEIGPKTDFADFMSDMVFVHPTFRTIDKFFESDVGNIYFYIFSHVGKRNFVRRRVDADVGNALHADEVSYLFDMGFIPEEPTAEDQVVIDKMTGMWANFVKHGDPTPQTSDLLNVKWEPISSDSPFYTMIIAPELSLAIRPWHERRAFLDLFFEANRHLMRVNLLT